VVAVSTKSGEKLLVRRVRERVPPKVWEYLGDRRVWIAPPIGLLLGLTLFPFLFLIYLTFHYYSLSIASQRGWAGLDNYTTILQSGDFYNSLMLTGTFVVTAVTIQLVLGLAIALFLHHRIPERWASFFQTIFLLPMMTAYIAVGLLWRYLFNGSVGFINYLMRTAGLPTYGWTGDPGTALATVIVADVWQWTPFVVLIVLAGLQGLPDSYYEVAELAGANRWQRFRYVTFPLIKPMLFVALIFRVADSYRIFDKVFIMTQGGPSNSSMVLSVYIYIQSFRNGSLGIGATASLLMLAIITVVALTMIRRARRTGVI
jgi:multiple sugar transport system permease protein